MNIEEYYTPTIEDFTVGFEYEMKIGFTDGTVKSLEDYNDSFWETHYYIDMEKPYIERALNGRNATKGICGIRAKLSNRKS